MSRLPVPGSDNDIWGSVLNDYLSVSLNPDGTLKAASDIAQAKAQAASAVQPTGLATVATTGSYTDLINKPAAVTIPDATTTTKGAIQLAGDLGGTAAVPTVPGLAGKADSSSLAAVATSGSYTDLTGKPSLATVATSGSYIDLSNKPTSQTTVLPYSYTGMLAVGIGAFRLYNDTPSSWTIQSVRASVGTAPTGASIIIDIDKNGTTIFTTQTNRPTIAASANTSGKVTNMDITSVAPGDYLTVDIAQIGSTVSGSNLTVQVEVM